MMESFDSEAISSIDLQIEHIFNENWRIYLLRDLESMYSVFCTMASALRKYSIYSCVFYFYSTCRGIICTEIWRILQQCEYCRFWQTDRNTARENKSRVDWDYKVGGKVLIRKDGVLRKGETKYQREPWTITEVHTNGTIRIQSGTKSERLNIRRVIPYFED